MRIRRKLRSIKHRALFGVANYLASKGYSPEDPKPWQSYSDLRVSIMCILEKEPGLRCYEVEQRLGLATTKQRVTNSILRDLEDDELLLVLDKRWDPITQTIKKQPREYYLDF